MDERIGRETAAYLGVARMGLIGVIIEAKRRGLVSAVRPLLDRVARYGGLSRQ